MKKDLSNEGRLRNITIFYMNVAVAMTLVFLKTSLLLYLKLRTTKKDLTNGGRLRNVNLFNMSAAVAMTWAAFKNFLAALFKTETNEERPAKRKRLRNITPQLHEPVKTHLLFGKESAVMVPELTS